MDGGEETRRRLVVSGDHGTEALEGVEAALDAAAQGVELPVKAAWRHLWVGLAAMTGFIPRARMASMIAREE